MGILEGTGSNNLWGFSRALDLQAEDLIASGETPFNMVQEELKSSHRADSATDLTSDVSPLNFLLIGSSDARHIIKTIARSHRHKKRHLNFYIIEPQASLLARQMLLLSIFTDDLSDSGLQERVELFIETYGNILVRQRTSSWIRDQSTLLIRTITDEKGPLAKNLDISALKFRERDDIEFVFKFWRDEARVFEAATLWDYRLQHYYKSRYDTRENAIDWDYHMNLQEAASSTSSSKISIVHKLEFLRWRMHGLAYEIRDTASSSTFSNRTMATVDILKQDGVGTAKWGYFSDVLTGPFLPFGVDTEYKSLLKTANDKHMHSSQEVTEVNLKALFHEYETGTLYHHDQPSKITELSESSDSTPTDPHSPWTLHFLPCNARETLQKRQRKYMALFDQVFISASMAHVLPMVSPLLKEGGKVIQECAMFMLELSKEQQVLFQEKLQELANEGGMQVTYPKEVATISEFMVLKKETSTQ